MADTNKEIPIEDLSSESLEELISIYQNELNKRKRKLEEDKRTDEELRFYKVLKGIQCNLLKEGINKTIEEIYKYDISDSDRYREVTIDIPELGEDIPCESDDCFYTVKRERVQGFTGNMYELMFSKHHPMICDGCMDYYGSDDDFIYLPWKLINFDKVEKKYSKLCNE
jgi:hypothetical protein